MVVILSDHDHVAERPAGELLTAATADHNSIHRGRAILAQ